MIFAAGLGTRLKPYTDTMPKALVPIEGQPMLWHQIQKLKAAGVDELVINVHHFAEQITNYVEQNDCFGIKVHISDESAGLLDTGGGLLKARQWLQDGDEPFLIHNVDIFSNLDLASFVDSGLEENMAARLLASDRNSSRKLLFDTNMHLCGWKNLKTGETKGPAAATGTGTSEKVSDQSSRYRELAFGGVHLISPHIFELFDEMPQFKGAFSIIDFYLAACTKKSVGAFAPTGLRLIDAGKADSIDEVATLMRSL